MMWRTAISALSAVIFILCFQQPAANARPALVFDVKSELVLYSEDQDRLWHPASLTKLMTAYLVFDAIKKGKFTLKDKVKCSPTALKQAPSKIGLPLGATMSVDLAIRSLIVKSANDVAVMLAEKVAGSHSQFARQMNQTAKRLGMTKSRFVNANGLPDARQVTTARDMAILARAILRDFPERRHFFSMSTVKVGKRRLRSHNSLLRTFEGADGMKTGFICASGFNVVASATRNDRQLVAIVLGAPSAGARSLRATKLLEHGFQNYFWKNLFGAAKLDALPQKVSLKGPVDVRRSVRSYACGYRAKKKYKNRKKYRKRKYKKKKTVKKKKQAALSTLGTASN